MKWQLQNLKQREGRSKRRGVEKDFNWRQKVSFEMNPFGPDLGRYEKMLLWSGQP